MGDVVKFEDKPKDVGKFHNLANNFLIKKKFFIYDIQLLRYWNGEFYVWRKHGEYELIEDMKILIGRYLQEYESEFASIRNVNEILNNVKNIVHLSNKVTVPYWLDKNKKANMMISLKNGILNVKALLQNEEDVLEDHYPGFFTLTALPYNYDPKADCPVWDKYLKEVLPNEQVRDMLQEWFGLNLVYDTSFDKFMLMVGDGANGKSVALCVLRELIGKGNYSTVSLEGFVPENRFSLVTTNGMLANICGDMGEIKRAGEGVIKQFVSGEALAVEAKGKQMFMMEPTARLTFATNTLPRFVDRSQGIWRRMLIIPFSQTIPLEQQDHRLREKDFWRYGPELPGVFMWAIEGLRRLYERGWFKEPEECRMARLDYEIEMNPARGFLVNCCMEGAENLISNAELFNCYREYCDANGYKGSLQSINFGKEVKKVFPRVSRVVSKDSSRNSCRHWKGIAWRGGLKPVYP